MEGIIVLIVLCIIGYISYLFQKNTNQKATKGNLSSTSVIYVNGCLGYQSGVEVKIQATTNSITVDEKYHIPVQKILDVKFTKTKQLVNRQNNVVGRAIVGTIIAGPVGAIVGGVSGAGNTTKTEDIEILNITYKDMNETEQNISFSWGKNEEKSVILNSWVLGLTNRSR